MCQAKIAYGDVSSLCSQITFKSMSNLLVLMKVNKGDTKVVYMTVQNFEYEAVLKHVYVGGMYDR